MCILCVKLITVILTVQGETKCYKNEQGRGRERKRERLKPLVEGAGKSARGGTSEVGSPNSIPSSRNGG